LGIVVGGSSEERRLFLLPFLTGVRSTTDNDNTVVTCAALSNVRRKQTNEGTRNFDLIRKWISSQIHIDVVVIFQKNTVSAKFYNNALYDKLFLTF